MKLVALAVAACRKAWSRTRPFPPQVHKFGTVPPREVGKVSAVANLTASGAIGTAVIATDVRVITMNQTTASLTFTLPSPSDTNVIAALDVVNIGTASFTMYGVTVASGSLLRLVWTGSAWDPDGGSLPSTATGSSTTSSTAVSATVPGGAIIKAGTLAVSSGTGTLTFPVAFPNACISVVGDFYLTGATATSSYSVTIKSYSATAFTVDVSSLGGTTLVLSAATGTITWLAVGY